jgi:hypothetical protein
MNDTTAQRRHMGTGEGTIFTISYTCNGKPETIETDMIEKAHSTFDLARFNPNVERAFLSDGTKQLAAYVRDTSLMFWSDTLGMMVSVPDA